MYKLYWAKDTGSLAPQILLEEAGVEYEIVELDLDRGDELKPEFLAINPRGQIPALQLPDGTIITESAAIMIHIADSHLSADLMPAIGSTQRAIVYRWLFYAVANIYEADLRMYYSERFVSESSCVESVKQTARQDMNHAWDLLEQELGDGPYLLGAEFSAIDPYLLMLAQWHEQTGELLARCSKLRRLCEAVKRRPATQKIWSQNFA